jgi:peroxiredoxin
MRADIEPGAKFPDFELTDHTGTRRRLSAIQGKQPMIVVLSRGHFCPKDRRQLRNLVDFYPELKVGYTQIVTISTDTVMETNEFRDALGAQWMFLSDPRRTVQKDLDITEYTDPRHDPMIPHTLLLEPELRVFKVYNGYWYWGRPSVDDLRRDLREMFMKIRPDWDITDPELQARWARGERDDFSRTANPKVKRWRLSEEDRSQAPGRIPTDRQPRQYELESTCQRLN